MVWPAFEKNLVTGRARAALRGIIFQPFAHLDPLGGELLGRFLRLLNFDFASIIIKYLVLSPFIKAQIFLWRLAANEAAASQSPGFNNSPRIASDGVRNFCNGCACPES